MQTLNQGAPIFWFVLCLASSIRQGFDDIMKRPRTERSSILKVTATQTLHCMHTSIFDMRFIGQNAHPRLNFNYLAFATQTHFPTTFASDEVLCQPDLMKQLGAQRVHLHTHIYTGKYASAYICTHKYTITHEMQFFSLSYTHTHTRSLSLTLSLSLSPLFIETHAPDTHNNFS